MHRSISTKRLRLNSYVKVPQTVTYQTFSVSIERRLRIRQGQSHTITHHTARLTDIVKRYPHFRASNPHDVYFYRHASGVIVSTTVYDSDKACIHTSEHNVSGVHLKRAIHLRRPRLHQLQQPISPQLRDKRRRLRCRHHLTKAKCPYCNNRPSAKGVCQWQTSNVRAINFRVGSSYKRSFVNIGIIARAIVGITALNGRQHSTQFTNVGRLQRHSLHGRLATLYTNA